MIRLYFTTIATNNRYKAMQDYIDAPKVCGLGVKFALTEDITWHKHYGELSRDVNICLMMFRAMVKDHLNDIFPQSDVDVCPLHFTWPNMTEKKIRYLFGFIDEILLINRQPIEEKVSLGTGKARHTAVPYLH